LGCLPDSIQWGKGREAQFVEYISSELIDGIAAREPLLQQWIRWLAQYAAPATQATKSFPYEGAANYVLPLTATDVDQLYAKFLQTVHAPEDLWTISPMNERWVDAAKPLQDMLTWLDRNILKMFNVNKRIILEMTKLGTGIYKTGWDYQRYPTLTYDAMGRVIKAEKTRGVPFVDHVRLADFVIPAYAYAIQPDSQGGAPWVAERMRQSVSTIRRMANATAPFLPNIEKDVLDLIVKFQESGATDYEEYVRQQEREVSGAQLPSSESLEWDKSSTQMAGQRGTAGTKAVREIELWEIHCRFGTKSNDSEDDIVVWFHQPTRKIVRGVYSYYTHGQRPYEVVRYFPGEGFYGIGVCQQKEVFQAMASDLFNFNWDNVLLANSRMVVAKSGSNIAPGEPFYPNKVWIVDDDVNKSFGVFPMADIYQSLPLLQSNVQAMGERRTSIGDLQLGNMESLPSRTPATTTLSMLQESNRRVDLTIKDMRYEGLSTVGLRVVQLMQQYASGPAQGGPNVGGQELMQLVVQTLGMPEGMEVAKKLTMPLEDAALGIGVSITATSGSANKEVEKQGYMGLLQLAAQLYPQFIQAIQFATSAPGTAGAAVALQSAQGLQELFQRLLEQYDVRNPEEILPLTDQTISAAEQAPGPGAAAGAQPGPAGANPGLNGGDPLQALLGGFGASV
jgi:hypothetical protein